MPVAQLSPAASAFDCAADGFDVRFAGWASVAAQRRAVRSELLKAFASGSTILEIGGGTGEDALWLADRGRAVTLTDVSPKMVERAREKFAGRSTLEAILCDAASLDLPDYGLFDGAFSNFAALNCVERLEPVALQLARLVRPGGSVLLVMFGRLCPGEWLVEAFRGRASNMFRRLTRNAVPARLGGNDFHVRYFSAVEVRQAMSPWFDYAGSRGIGVFIPPSAAEPWISRWPGAVAALEATDRLVSRPLASLGDHVLYRFVRRHDG